MTVDPETKKYIDQMMFEHVVKVSAFLSALCNKLEDKNLLAPGEFNVIMANAHQMANLMINSGAKNVSALMDFKEQIDKLIKERNWDDLV
jgi:hypothetical protein